MTWYILPNTIPNNAETVYIRIKYYYGQPFEAVYSVANQDFTSVTNSIVYPAWAVARWAR